MQPPHLVKLAEAAHFIHWHVKQHGKAACQMVSKWLADLRPCALHTHVEQKRFNYGRNVAVD